MKKRVDGHPHLKWMTTISSMIIILPLSGYMGRLSGRLDGADVNVFSQPR